jgi:xylulokinase
MMKNSKGDTMIFIGIDLGTTNIKAALYAEKNGALSRMAISSCPMMYTRSRREVEFDADKVVETVLELLKELENKGIADNGNFTVKQIALTGQAESLILLGKDMRPLRPALSWMDERSSAECEELAKSFSPEECYAVTGQKAIIPTWPATKILHLSRTEPDIISKTATFIMLKDYVAYRLSGVMAADKSIATFSFYFDIHRGCYWQKMLDTCGIRTAQLPPLVEPCTVLGTIDPALPLGPAFANTQVNTGTLDHFAGMIGNGIASPGGLSESTGTVMAMAALVRLPLTGNESAALHYGPFPGTMVLLPVAESGGICLEWFKNNFLADLSFDDIDKKIKEREPKNLLFLPYITGTNAPEFDHDASGVFYGLRQDTDGIDMACAVMEGVAFLLDKNLEDMKNGGLNFSFITSSGGGAKSDIWSQIKADICGLEIRIPTESEAACFGSAIIAAVNSGTFKNYEEAVSACVHIAKRFLPGDTSQYRAKKAGFAVLYEGMLKTAKAMFI